ncbi:MAG TPA: FAD-dependent oxidoreductase [Candidatus Saccharimonadales bacterium]|nr:FAD-dependent oxidoreductase [Candidatus Saccharimonadales bacterium]
MPITYNANIPISVSRIKELTDNVLSLYFKRPMGFNYEAGDWIDLGSATAELKGGKTYSLASAPTERDLSIIFRKGISPFKQHLENLKTGDELIITQFGNDYGFHIKENRSSVLIAGGIGIAPFRSMLKEMVDLSSTNTVEIIYFNKGQNYLLESELEKWKSLINLKVTYINTTLIKRKDRDRILSAAVKKGADHYFIAGPEEMVENTEHSLIALGVRTKDIRIDSFGGY